MLKRGQAIHTRVGGRGAAAAKKKPGADKKSYTGEEQTDRLLSRAVNS